MRKKYIKESVEITRKIQKSSNPGEIADKAQDLTSFYIKDQNTPLAPSILPQILFESHFESKQKKSQLRSFEKLQGLLSQGVLKLNQIESEKNQGFVIIAGKTRPKIETYTCLRTYQVGNIKNTFRRQYRTSDQT